MIEPTDTLETLHPSSRLRCGKIHVVEWNVKVRDIGMVASRDRSKLLRYYRDEQHEGSDPDDDYHEDNQSQIPSSNPQPIYRPMLQHSADFPASGEAITGSPVSQMPAR
jgi:hypothetical protein